MTRVALFPLLLIALAPQVHAEDLTLLDQWRLPAVSHPADNPPSEAKAKLGKALFFDPRLSGNRELACASCHHPGLGWADALPHRQDLGRHTPTLINIAYANVFFWDGHAASLEEAIEQHIMSPVVMRSGTAEEIVMRLRALPAYRRQFDNVFQEDISMRGIVAALAVFIRGVIVDDSPFDRWVAHTGAPLPASAQRGFYLFVGKAGCARCHRPPAFTDSLFHNIGLNSIDPGHYEVSQSDHDRNAFKTPGLRHIAVTAPYMHDGSKASLDEVIDFYDRGGDRPGDNNELTPLKLSAEEKHDLQLFLTSLTGKRSGVVLPPLPIGAAMLP